MDNLAPELVIHVLSFVPGHEVPRLKGLNSRIRKIINRNRSYVKYPATLHLYSQRDNEISFMSILNDQIGTSCKIMCGNCDAVTVEMSPPVITDQNIMTEGFIQNTDWDGIEKGSIFYPLTAGNTSLRSVFDHIFQKANIKRLDLRNIKGESLKIFGEAINSSRCHVDHIVIDLKHTSFREHFELLRNIARRQYKCPPSIDSCVNYITDQWENIPDIENILMFNQIAHMFKNPVVFVDANNVDELIEMISDEWNRKNVRFYLRLRVPHFSSAGKYFGLDEVSFSTESDGKTIRVQHWRKVHVENGVFRLEEVQSEE